MHVQYSTRLEDLYKRLYKRVCDILYYHSDLIKRNKFVSFCQYILKNNLSKTKRKNKVQVYFSILIKKYF